MAITVHLPRPVRAALALVVLVVLAGATYQGITTSIERRRFPHPGRLVDVGGHQLHILCSGNARPIVVLEAPAAGLSVSWTHVQAALSSQARVCSYDRSGLGWSERGDNPYDPASVPDELRRLLAEASEKPPFVVAGDGLGATFARAFASRFAADTAALVLLDPPGESHPSRDRASLGHIPAAMPWLARAGWLRVGLGPQQTRVAEVRAFMNRPDHLTRAAIEIARWDDAVRLSTGRPLPATLPVVSADLPGPLADERSTAAALVALRSGLERARRAR